MNTTKAAEHEAERLLRKMKMNDSGKALTAKLFEVHIRISCTLLERLIAFWKEEPDIEGMGRQLRNLDDLELGLISLYGMARLAECLSDDKIATITKVRDELRRR